MIRGERMCCGVVYNGEVPAGGVGTEEGTSERISEK
jgi:hypothetical protein